MYPKMYFMHLTVHVSGTLNQKVWIAWLHEFHRTFISKGLQNI